MQFAATNCFDAAAILEHKQTIAFAPQVNAIKIFKGRS